MKSLMQARDFSCPPAQGIREGHPYVVARLCAKIVIQGVAPLEGRKRMVRWEHRYLLGTMVFTIAGDVVRDFDEEYEAWSWLEQEGWGLVAIEPPDPVRPGVSKYYFKRQKLQSSMQQQTAVQPVLTHERRGKR